MEELKAFELSIERRKAEEGERPVPRPIHRASIRLVFEDDTVVSRTLITRLLIGEIVDGMVTAITTGVVPRLFEHEAPVAVNEVSTSFKASYADGLVSSKACNRGHVSADYEGTDVGYGVVAIMDNFLINSSGQMHESCLHLEQVVRDAFPVNKQ